MRKLSLKIISWFGLILSLFLLFGCGDSPTDPDSQFSINLNGGDADPAIDGSVGGDAGYFYVESYGELTLTISSDFNIPIPLDPTYGSVPYTVDVNETVQLDEDTTIGKLYVLTGDTNLYLGDGNILTSDDAVTGLFIPDGITLKLPDNTSGNGFWAWLDNDIVINGTVKTDPESLNIYFDTLGNLIVGSTGLITTKPVTPDMNGGDITLLTGIEIFNQGIIDASGVGGGDAASITLDASGAIYNTGTVRADGGNSTTGDAGFGGYIDLYADNDTLFSSGTLSAIGGNAANGIGGDGGYIYLENDGTRPQDILISGILQANGGSGDLSGGMGGGIDLYAYSDGKCTISNVDGIMLNGGEGETGGIGGDMVAYTYSPDPVNTIPAYAIDIDMSISANGGFGSDTGGDGGIFDIETDTIFFDASTFITTTDILRADGGDSGTDGGFGGMIDINSTGAPTFSTFTPSAAGGIGGTSDGGDGDITIDGILLP
jgi:hypothetical protein